MLCPLVLEAVTVDPARRQWQHAVSAVECLNGGGLLVDAEHRRVTGWIRVEPDDVGRLRLEVGVGGRHVARQPVRSQIGLAPDALDDVLAHPEMSRQAPAGPMRRPVRRWAPCSGQHPSPHPRRQLPRRSTPVAVGRALHAVLQEPTAPTDRAGGGGDDPETRTSQVQEVAPRGVHPPACRLL